MSASEILEQIRRLPPAERQQIVDTLSRELEVADDTLTPEQIAELDKRLDDFEKNPSEGIPLEQVEAEMKKRFGWK